MSITVVPAIRRLLGLGPSRGGVVLLYHRVASLEHDPHSLAISPEHFAQHLDVLVEHGVPMPLTEMVALASAGDVPPGAVAVTFDDGYADNLLNAAPLLAAAGVPATMFLSTGAIVNQSEFWWDDIERATPRQSHRPLTQAEVVELASQPGIAIGAHTHNHPSLASLPRDIQYQEIAESKRVLEGMLAMPVTNFAYPFGGRHDVSDETRAAAAAAGMTIACTTVGGRVRRDTDPLSVPRVLVRDWSGEAFAQRFMEWAGVAAR
jgi:peptidoglycan/xylan/chitin deacetylase (PgdA/CDA1 family)